MLHQPLGLQMKLSHHHIYELRGEFGEDSTYFTFNNSPSRFIYNVNNDLVAALRGEAAMTERGEAVGWEGSSAGLSTARPCRSLLCSLPFDFPLNPPPNAATSPWNCFPLSTFKAGMRIDG